MIDPMWPTGNVHQWRDTVGSPPLPAGPAMTTLRSVVAPLASTIRSAGIVYVAGQIAIWHSFYTADAWRLTAPVIAMAWATAVIVCLRRRWPSPFLVCVDSGFYLALALCAQQCVPPNIRDDAFSWVVISMSGQLIIPAWYAPGSLAVLLTLIAPAAYWIGNVTGPVTNTRTLAGATMVLIVVGLVHNFSRRELYGRAGAADATLDAIDHAAGEQYAVLARNIERREHERLLHDTVLNTLTALARAGRDDVAEVVSRCRQDVALIEGALSDPGNLETDAGRPYGDVLSGVQAVAAQARARGLRVHVDVDGREAPAVSAPVATAVWLAAREALSNVAAHAGTGEAWVRVSLIAPGGNGQGPGRLQVTVRDTGIGFDPVGVDQTRLGLRRSKAERMTDCGGHASIWSVPGRGTVVRISWPAPAEPAHAAPAGRLLVRESPSW